MTGAGKAPSVVGQRWSRDGVMLMGAVALCAGFVSSARAQLDPLDCEIDGLGETCTNDASCAAFSSDATLCSSGEGGAFSCQIPCEDGVGKRAPEKCSYGEVCMAASDTRANTRYVCRAASFAMDLNLLDTCIYYWVEEIQPEGLASADACSLERNLHRMLDRNANRAFDIFDLDLCVQDFLEQPPCNTTTGRCDDGQIYCNSDAGCGLEPGQAGVGLHCNTELHRCERQCGLMHDRARDDELSTLERTCAGSGQVCDYTRGECVAASEGATSCQVDADCPSGDYCLVGQCAPKCYRSIDCPDSHWYCARTNECRPKPKNFGGQEQAFDPKGYAVRFASQSVKLDLVDDSYDIPVLIMDRNTKKQVSSNANLVFGYRLEVKYGRKQEPACLGSLAGLTAQQVAECTVSSDEEFLALENPFGTVFAEENPALGIRLNHGNVRRLNPGKYEASLTVIFDNGSTSTATIHFEKPGPSGEYTGRLSVYIDDAESNSIAGSPLGMRLYVAKDQPEITWDELIKSKGLSGDELYVDVTRGYKVSGYIHGEQSLIFDLPGARTNAENEIPVVGLYSERLGRMRLVTVLDVASDACWSDRGACTGSAQALEVRNPFGRAIRRTVEFIGPFHAAARRFEGIYRESITGLVPPSGSASSVVTLDGGFIVTQLAQDARPLGFDGLRLPTTGSAVRFPVPSLSADLTNYCSAAERAHVASKQAFDAYMASFGGSSAPVFQNLVSFKQVLSSALASLDRAGPELSLAEFLRGQITFCGDQNRAGCIDENAVRCGLALYRKAIHEGWVNMDAVLNEPTSAQGFGTTCADHAGCAGLEASVCINGQCRTGHGERCESNALCQGYAPGLLCMDGTCQKSCDDGSGNPEEDACGDSEVCVPGDSPAGTRHHCVLQPSASLFCGDGIPGTTANCRTSAWQAKDLVALQDHNRFYRYFFQTLAFRANKQLTDSAYTLFKWAEAGADAFSEADAYTYKQNRLLAALADYDRARQQVLSPIATEVFWRWPVHAFEGRGDVWIKQLHTVLNDRMGTLVELLDLRRRVLKNSGQNDFLFAQHVMHMEYLSQAYLAILQKHWQKEQFHYAGEGPRMMDRGQNLIEKASDSRNPFGMQKDRVFFENPDRNVSNWQWFRDRLEAKVEGLEHDTDAVIGNLRGAWRDRANLETNLLVQRQQLDARLDELCGSEAALPTACPSDWDEKQKRAQCLGSDCDFSFACADDDAKCESVVQQFSAAAASFECRADAVPYTIELEGPRACMRGRMGQLTQERAALTLQREQLYRQVKVLLRRIAQQQQYLEEAQSENEDFVRYLAGQARQVLAADVAITGASLVYDVAVTSARAVKCTVIAGLAAGTDCPQAAISGALEAAAIAAKYAVIPGLQAAKTQLALSKEIELTERGNTKEARATRQMLDNLVTEVENLIAQYEAITQQLYNLNLQVRDTLFVAQSYADRYEESLADVLDNLSGSESGNVLVANRRVIDFNAAYQAALRDAYKMVQAFVHRYNVEDEARFLTEQAYRAVTVRDLKELVRTLREREATYCAAEGIDCDAVNEDRVLEFSLRKQLFPTLRDIVDPQTGRTLSAGEQFHNLITSSAYVQRRLKSNLQTGDQIEIPFAIWLNDRGQAGRAPVRYLDGLAEDECNHILTAERSIEDSGTWAVNVIGENLQSAGGIKVRLERGDTDYIRSCKYLERPGVPLINTYTIGWSDLSENGAQDLPQAFYSRSLSYSACVNNSLLTRADRRNEQHDCFHYFARDRSLAAPDWKLIVPEVDRDQSWLMEGDRDNPPVIHDIVLYFRYSARPTRVPMVVRN